MIHRNRMGWWWLTIPFVSSNCPPLVNVIIVAKVTRHYWVDSDSSRSLSLSLSLSPHTHTHTVVHSRLQKKISYMWASEVDPASILVGNGGDCWFSRNDAYVAFAMLVSAAVDCLLEDFPSITPACCMCKVLPTRFIANWVAKVTFHYVRVDLRYESLEWLFRWNKKLRIAVGVLML